MIKVIDISLEKILWLSDTDVNQALCLIGNQFKNIGGLVDPVLFQERALHEFDPKVNDSSIFIIQSNGNHWVTYIRKNFGFIIYLNILLFFKGNSN